MLGSAPLPREADDGADHAAGRAPHVDAVGVQRRSAAAPRSAGRTARSRGSAATSRERSTSSRTVLSRCASSSTVPPDRRRLGADAREASSTSVCGEKSRLAGVAQLDGADELAVQHHRRPGERRGSRAAAGRSRARRPSPSSAACRQATAERGRVALYGRPSRAVAHAAPERPGSSSPPSTETASRSRSPSREVDVAARRARQSAQDARRSRPARRAGLRRGAT